MIGQLVVRDPDNEGMDGVVQNFTLAILSDNEGRFYIDGDELKVRSCLGIGAVPLLPGDMYIKHMLAFVCPHRLTFTWWGCYGLCLT